MLEYRVLFFVSTRLDETFGGDDRTAAVQRCTRMLYLDFLAQAYPDVELNLYPLLCGNELTPTSILYK
jgi:hypothetical protein